MERSAKHEWREEMTVSLDKSTAVFFAQYSGMTVEDLTTLRRDLRKADAKFSVVKNSIAKKAIAGRKEDVAKALLKGQTAAVYAFGDAAAAAKIITEFAKKNDKLKVVGGYMESAALTAGNVANLASLPSREVLISKILGSMTSAHRGLLGVLQAVPRDMVSVLNQIAKTKTEAAG